jgi:hypothetical protein
MSVDAELISRVLIIAFKVCPPFTLFAFLAVILLIAPREIYHILVSEGFEVRGASSALRGESGSNPKWGVFRGAACEEK